MDEPTPTQDRSVPEPAAPPSVPAQQGVWHCVVQGERYGPVSTQELIGWATQGRVMPATLVWREEMPEWAPMAQCPELAAELGRLGMLGPAEPTSLADNAGMRMVLPIGRSGPAIGAGYLGLLSIIPIVGLLALGCGIWAIHDLKTHPKLHGMGRAIFGLVMGAAGTIFWIWMIVMRALA